MSRPLKTITDEELEKAAFRLSHGLSLREATHRLNEERGVFRKSGKARRDAQVSHELLRQRLVVQEVEAETHGF